jgi:hypothetical protein
MVMSPTGGKVFLHLRLVPLQSVSVLGLRSELAQEVEMEAEEEEEEEEEA